MRYWDVANRIVPDTGAARHASRWRSIARRLVGDAFPTVRDDSVDVDVAAAMASRICTAPDGGLTMPTGPRWPRTLHGIGSLGAGGAERQLVNLLVNLAAQGHDQQTLLTMHPMTGDGAHYLPLLRDNPIDLRVTNEICPEGIELIRRNEDIVRLIRSMPPSFNSWTLDLWVDIALAKPDIAHFWLDHTNIWGGAAALLAGVPAVLLSTRNVHPGNFPYLHAPYMLPWYVWLAQCSRVQFINNSAAGAESYAEWMGVPRSRFEVIVNGVDLTHIERADASERRRLRAEIGLPQSAIAVVGAFRMSEEKRPLLFVETFARAAWENPALHAVLMGEGPLLDAVKAKARQLGVARRFHAIGRRTDLPKVLSAMDVFLHTAWWEGTPNVVLEAQQLQLPVVVTRAGGAAEAVAHGETGYLVDRDDVDELYKRLVEVIGDLGTWTRRAQQGPRFIARRFGAQRMVDETLALQLRCLEDARPRADVDLEVA
jgi:glycosyltransferase involved in cell wall biosynthesis